MLESAIFDSARRFVAQELRSGQRLSFDVRLGGGGGGGASLVEWVNAQL